MTPSSSPTTFTPGPWSVGPEGVIASRRPYHMEDGMGRITEWVAECIGTPRSFEESKANARLIAAAPDLYEALIDWRNTYLCPLSDIEESATRLLEATDAALAKARGEVA